MCNGIKLENVYTLRYRPVGMCENIKCKRKTKTELNILEYSNGIKAYICDTCLKNINK